MKIRDTWLDFYILLLIFSLIAGGIAAGYNLLFGREEYIGRLTLDTEALPSVYRSYIEVGDIVYDTRTKRRIGEITRVDERWQGGEIALTLEIDAVRLPSGAALRTKRLWFKYKDSQAAHAPSSKRNSAEQPLHAELRGNGETRRADKADGAGGRNER